MEYGLNVDACLTYKSLRGLVQHDRVFIVFLNGSATRRWWQLVTTSTDNPTRATELQLEFESQSGLEFMAVLPCSIAARNGADSSEAWNTIIFSCIVLTMTYVSYFSNGHFFRVAAEGWVDGSVGEEWPLTVSF